MTDRGEHNGWLVLIHQFQKKPGSLRVKIWRRLQSIGAVSVKNSMYVLPVREQTREDFEWILQELLAGGADGAIMECRFIGGMEDDQVRGLFDQSRDTDYRDLADQIRSALETEGGTSGEDGNRETGQHIARFRKRLDEIDAIDFFDAPGRQAAEGLMVALTDRLRADETTEAETTSQALSLDQLKGRVWVTRRHVRVDRIASAWLLRRWIDPSAVFKFTSSKDYSPGPREVRFDMFDAEFTHEGDRCTFEVLVSRAGLEDPALASIAEIIHDIDLKDNKYSREETAGIAHVLDGIAAGLDDDDQRIERGSLLLDDLYRYFSECHR